MKISIELIQKLREKTGIGLGLCKKALEETAGVIEEAIDWLKKQGHAQAAKVADRETTQGLVAFASDKDAASLIVLSCETDFVSGNEQFGKFAHDVAVTAAKNKSTNLEDLKKATLEDGSNSGNTVEQGLLELISSIKENIKLSAIDTVFAGADEHIVGYVYRTKVNEVPNIGSRACVVIYKGVKADEAKAIAKDVAMHVVANNTQYLHSEDIPTEFIAKEKEIFRERMKAEGKPENMLDKIVEGKVGQMYKEHALMHQMFFKEPTFSIGEYIGNNGVQVIKFISLRV